VCFGLYDGDSIVGFCGVLHQPHSQNRKLKRVSRLVVLPDYQGIGLGTKFLNVVAEYYTKLGFDFRIVTSAKNMIFALNKSEHWKMIRWSVNKCNSDKSKIDGNRKSKRNDCKTGGFRYI
jgi:GNAT superfamily N-acetyltransferase